MEPASGIEPPTCGLRNRCSATELRRLVKLRNFGCQALLMAGSDEPRGTFIPFVAGKRQPSPPLAWHMEFS
jgi:hypothetical protein